MKNPAAIKVGFCVAYDWNKLRHSLPPVYETAGTVCIALDRRRRTWSGQTYAFDEAAFRELLARLDPACKIDLYEDDFSRPELGPMENETRQRNLLAARLGQGGWQVQLDVDEYFLDFPAFAERLRKLDPCPTPASRPLCVHAEWIPLFKRVEGGYLVVDFAGAEPERTPVASNVPDYQRARRSRGGIVNVAARMVHETWARDETELLQKLRGWGHSNDFAVDSYFALWKAVDARNHGFLRDLHPLSGSTWPRLRFCEAGNLDELIQRLATTVADHPRAWYRRG